MSTQRTIIRMQAPTHLARLPDSTLIALRAQLEVIRSFDASLLSTVYWSLGTLAVIVAVLIGLGWFANFRVYQRDLEGIRRELEALVAKSVAELKGTLESSMKDLVRTARKELEQNLSTRIGSLANDLVLLKCEFFRFTFDTRVANKDYSMAATAALRMLQTALELKVDTFTNIALTGLVDSIDNGGTLTLAELRIATDLLALVPGSYAILRDRAKAALTKAKTF